MATLVFSAAGAALGSAIGGTFLGVSATVIGRAVGGYIGRVIDQRLMGGLSPIEQEGPRLNDLEVLTSREGAPLADLSGRHAIAGEVIWATNLKERRKTKTKSAGSGKNKQSVTTKTYSYSVSLAISLCEGPVAGFGRIWLNDKMHDLSDMIEDGRVRFYTGTEAQTPDPLIVSVEGGAPAYRGVAYVVFEDLQLEDFGNRIPNIKVEVFGKSGEMESLIEGTCIIPSSTEWGYLPRPVKKQRVVSSGGGVTSVPGFPSIPVQNNIKTEGFENAIRHKKIADWTLSMDHMESVLPNAGTASLVVAWFGTDLRAGLCEIEPRVERKEKRTNVDWRVSGLTREAANEVSQLGEDQPAYGSTPADISVIEAIQDLKARGKRVVLYPFVMMDITEAQALPHPSGSGTQEGYPWRGRIIPDTAQNATSEIAAFMGSAAPGDFSVNGSTVDYSGPAEWRFRRFILHLAHLAQAAGGVDAFLIGSEMRGLSMSPDSPGDYPFVTALKSLAADVKAVLPSAQVSYAADWSEYMNHSAGGDLRFHLDPLWSDANIDFVAIDNYLPVSDWRDGTDHADYDPDAGITSPYDLAYLKANIEGGEYFDWYYASDADRAAQVRTPITDGAYGEPWVFRQKAIRDWHANAHHERIGGLRQSSPTAWVPGSKPIWFTEIGCPAVDKGGNQPNKFVDPKSVESAAPHFSAGVRDDFMQRQYLRAMLEWWRDNGTGIVMPSDIQVWAWDARPWPEFPAYTGVWSDGDNWARGHWLNGRAGTAPAAEMIARRLTRHGLTADDFDLRRCYGQADGYPATAPIGFRDYLQPLEIGLALQANEALGKVLVESRAAARTVEEVPVSYMVESDQGPVFSATRGALEDVASTAIVRFIGSTGSYEPRAHRATLGAGREEGASTADLSLVLNDPAGQQAAERLLRAAADGRESIRFHAPRSATHIRPGAVVPVRLKDQAPRPMIIDRVVTGEALEVEARSFSLAAFSPVPGVYRPQVAGPGLTSGAIMTRILDLPILPGSAAEDWDSLIACHADPWPGELAIARSNGAESGYGQITSAPLRAVIGETTAALPPAGPELWRDQSVTLDLFSGALVGRPEIDVLSGENALAVQHPDGWEILQFVEADLIGPGAWRISRLLRGRLGTEAVMANTDLPAGAAVVVLDSSVVPLETQRNDLNATRYYRIGPASESISGHVIRAHTAQAVGWRPYAPCHLRASDSGGDITLTWVRRTRIDGEADWRDGVADVPLGEASELYEVEVVHSGTVKRSAQVSAPSFTYTAAMAASDGVSAPYTLRVAQVSDSYGPGARASLEII